MLTYKDVEHLDRNDPLYQKFWDEVQKIEDMYRGEEAVSHLTDEESYDYFNRYIAERR